MIEATYFSETQLRIYHITRRMISIIKVVHTLKTAKTFEDKKRVQKYKPKFTLTYITPSNRKQTISYNLVPIYHENIFSH